jgi:AraC family transcriptional regulator, transcriptional activator of pobA
MKKRTIPVYNIDAFQDTRDESEFYANHIRLHIKKHNQMILLPHKHNFYMSLLFTAGSGTHIVEFVRYKIEPGVVFMLGPGKVHTYELSDDIDGIIFFHSKEFFDLNFTFEKVDQYPFFSSVRNSPLIVLPKPSTEKIEGLFNDIVGEYEGRNFMRLKIICSYIHLLYIALTRAYLPEKLMDSQNLRYLSKVQLLEDLIDKNFRTIKSVRSFAKLMFVSEKHLNRMVKTSLNKTTSDLISERIILEAKRELAFSKKNVSEIIDDLGYDDSAYFFRFFKKKTSYTPSEFLNQVRNQ